MNYYYRHQSAEVPSRTPTTPHKQGWSGSGGGGSRSGGGGGGGGGRGKCGGRSREGMDLSYVTERILALWFPADVGQAAYRQGHQEAAHMLHSKHGTSYMVFNLSEPRRGARREHERVRELGWPTDLAPPLERLCAVCKDIDSWLAADSSRIAVLHARGNRERIGVVVAAYMHYSSICGSPEQALDRFAMKRFLDHKIGDLELPSNRRYVDYFSGLLSGSIRINSAPLYLTHVTVLGAPAFENFGCGGGGGGCRAFLKVYEGLIPVYTSGVHTVGGDTRQFTVNIAAERQRRGLQLRGDILVKCYHRHYGSCVEPADPGGTPTGEPPLQRELIFACQFHTCAVSDYTLSFTRQELDTACNDLRFPLDGAVELHFSGRSDGARTLNPPAPTPAVPVDMSPDPVTRWDSYEHLDHLPTLSPPDSDDTEDTNECEVGHTYGPLDGSLYATVAKKPAEEVILSPHTVSMDSGISSAGNGLQQSGGLVAVPPPAPAPAPVPGTAELDRLLNDMLMTVRDIPDLGPPPPPPPGPEDIPYHARQDSRPFTYGHLASPGLVRKATPPPRSSTTTTTLTVISSPLAVPQPPPPVVASPAPPQPPTSPDFHEGGLDRAYRSLTASPSEREWTVVSGSISQHSTNNLTWLQRQQQKLRDRKELQLKWEREATESRLLTELRTRASPSRRPDGYTSDTTHIDDEEDDFSVPLHVNIGGGKAGGGGAGTGTGTGGGGGSAPVSPLLPHRTSSRRHTTMTRHSPSERPFVAVKRAHEQSRKYSESSRDTFAPEQHASSDHDSGLLSMVDGEGSDALGSLIASLAATRTSSNSSDDTNTTAWPPPPTETQLRDEGYSWRTTSTSEGTGSPGNSPRPQTPAFPVHPRTPYSNSSHTQFDTAGLPPKSPTAQRKEWSPVGEILLKERDHSTTSSLRGYESSDQHSPKQSPGFSGLPNGTLNGGHSSPSPTVYYGHSRRSSIHSNSEPPQEVSPAHVKFVRDTSRFWYKPTISREEAIAMLRDQSPGTFVVRDSNSFPGAFGLALKVATPPPNAGKSPSGDPANELVRHFLIEPTSRGVRLKGCANEPVFSSLSALVYQHSLLPLALPCRLVLPESDLSRTNDPTGTLTNAQMLLAQGAACNVLYLTTVDTESLTGPQAIVRAMTALFSGPLPTAAVVHFKVSGQGITLTDNKRQLFFRRHYPVATISYCGLDPDDHQWSQKSETGMPVSSFRCFGFVARKPASKTDNQCHVFAELEPGQPATAIVNFVSKVMMSNNQAKANIV